MQNSDILPTALFEKLHHSSYCRLSVVSSIAI